MTILLFNASTLSSSTSQATPSLKSLVDSCFHHNHLLPSPSAAASAVAASHSRHRHRRRCHLHYNCHIIGYTRHSHSNAVFRSAHRKKDADSDSVSVGTSLKPKQSQPQIQIEQHQSLLLGLSLQELSDKLQGSGRALAVWDCLRLGIDPNLYYYSPSSLTPKVDYWNGKYYDDYHRHDADGISTDGEISSATRRDDSDGVIYDAWIAANSASMTMVSHDVTPDNDVMHSSSSIDGRLVRTERKIILPGQGLSNRGRKLGYDAWNKLQKCMTLVGYDAQPNNTNDDETTDNKKSTPRWKKEHYLNEHQHEKAIYTIDNSIASLSHLKVSPDGTTKLLLKMKLDGLEVESVIIPWMDKGFSTLCVS